MEVPDENTMAPEPPASPEFADTMVRAPDELAVPSPLDRNIAPPVCTVDRPAWPMILPPAPLVPEPTVMEMAPPVPPVAGPDPTNMDPLLPSLVVPDENATSPLAPAAPEFADLMVNAPDEVAVPSPLDMYMTPPVFTVDLPACATT